MDDAQLLHYAAVKVKPQEACKPSTIWVAVLHLDNTLNENNTTEDWLWVKCHGRISAQTIKDQYEKRHVLGEEFVLQHDSKPLANLQVTMSELDTYHDHIVAFEAVKASDTSKHLFVPPEVQPLPNPLTIKGTVPGLPLPAELTDMSRAEYLAIEKTLGHDYGRDHVAGYEYFVDTEGENLLELFPHWGQSEWEGTAMGLIRHYWVTRSAAERIYYINKAETTTKPKPLVDEPPTQVLEVGEQKPKNFQLPSILKDASPETLEASVEQGLKLLDQLAAPLVPERGKKGDIGQWLQSIDNLRKHAVKTRTIIGVVGNTGAGKSSVINAMLDEERLVPTNCMRACTAVVTEISYNYDEEPYRAQVEFISSVEWQKELETLFQDLLDSNGQVSRECANEDTDAGIAYAKIKAVYPKKTKDDIAHSDPETMLSEVSTILGSMRDIKENDPLIFYKKLQHYVDSKEKSTGSKDKEKKKEGKEMEFWPLIRVVRIYVKSSALATGAVIVDLPGVHDANAARAAVAENYMKECTGLWIVAPITRAVDDKAAKSLLGQSFKRQLKMDGGYNNNRVTFICSKTDDISREEAQRSLGIEDEMAPDWAELEQLNKTQTSIKNRLKELKDSKAVYSEAVNDADEQIETWDTLKDELEEGKIVFPPTSERGATKRKRSSQERSERKRSRRSGSIESDPIEDSEFENRDSEDDEDKKISSEDETDERAPLNREQIAAKLQELKSAKKEARRQKAEITEQITALQKEISAALAAEEKIESKMSAMCISGRNQYSKGAIQQDFAAGIKELDQELAAEDDEENFDPDAEARDYDVVARGLPVFCVSSRAYQKLQGRFRKDPVVQGFKCVEETEIPQLQAHCEKLTEVGRSAHCRNFINKLTQLLNSMLLWASTDARANLTAEQRAVEAKYLQKGMEMLESGLEKAIDTASTELTEDVAHNIFDKFDTAVSNATNDAIDTTSKWGSPVNRIDRSSGGVAYPTYKAIVRRNGVYTNSQGLHQWNAQLAEPMFKCLSSGWERTFARRLPFVMNRLDRNSSSALRNFHRDVAARAGNLGSNGPRLSMLEAQVSVYEHLFRDLSLVVKGRIGAAQKEINREFTPVIEKAMIGVYEQCTAESGRGSFARMKDHMNGHISNKRNAMFQDSVDNAHERLDAMLKNAREYMDERTDEVLNQVRRDYRSILGGGDTFTAEGEMLPKGERLARRDVTKAIKGAERTFRRIAGDLSIDDDEEMNADFCYEEEGEMASDAREQGEIAAGIKSE